MGIAGTVVDSSGDMTLWRTPMAKLAPGARLSVEKVSALPPSSEGLTRLGGSLLVVTDGDEGDGPTCAEPAGQLRVAAP